MSSKNAEDSKHSGRSAAPLDETAYRILEVLRDNGRVSIAALADKVGISRANAYTRVESLVHDGIITGFSARVDQAKAGLSIGALVFVSFDPNGLLSGYTTLPIQIFNWTGRPQEGFHQLAAATSILLLIVLILMNAVAILIRNKYQRRW